jgi:8-amino-7-oxononanoate synthase
MSGPSRKGRLPAAAKDAAFALAGKGLTRAPPARAAARPSSASSPKAADFTQLPAYQELKTQRGAAALLQIDDPFFRTHDARAGATSRIASRQVVNFASYDYLGLNQHPDVGAAAKAAIDAFGTSVSASRLVAGERPFHRELEAKIASFYGVENAVAFVSGHATNVTAISALVGRNDLVITDALIHNSAVVGAELSGAARRSFPHSDLQALETILAESRAQHRNVLIAVEGLYSMDGDVPDLPRLIDIKNRHGAWLMVDEAHALGVLGARGRGIAEHFGIDPRGVDIWMGTLSKTLASCGGFIAGSTALVDILKCSGSGFVYSVGMAPPVAAAAIAAFDLIDREPERIARLQENCTAFLAKAKAAGLDTGLGQGFAVVPIMVGDSLRAAKLAERLLDHGINVMPIVYPAVPMQAARLRFFISAEHTEEQIDTAIAATKLELHRLIAAKFGLAQIAASLAASDMAGKSGGAGP